MAPSLRRLFELDPRAKTIYEFPLDADMDTIRKDPRFKVHARNIVDMFDCAVSLLGPELDSLSGALKDLGRRHLRYGVHPSYLPVMSQAVCFALDNMLKSKFTRSDRLAWEGIMQFMVTEMVDAMTN